MNFLNASGSNTNTDTVREAEATLRLIASLPAPSGLEDRVITGLRAAPRTARVLNFSGLLNPTGNWLRAAAAAAIAFVVIGGGWSIYSRVQPGGVAATVPQAGHSNGFSNAGAVRVPQTLRAPVVTDPALVPVAPVEPAKDKVKTAPHRQLGANTAKANKDAKAHVAKPTP